MELVKQNCNPDRRVSNHYNDRVILACLGTKYSKKHVDFPEQTNSCTITFTLCTKPITFTVVESKSSKLNIDGHAVLLTLCVHLVFGLNIIYSGIKYTERD